MNIIREHIVVKVPSVFIEESKYKGLEGKTIILNVLYNPEQHVRCYGIVTSVPDDLTATPLFSDHIGAPAYHDYPTNTWKTNEDIQLEVQVGDKVYFHYNCLLPDQQGGSLYNKLYLKSEKDAEGQIWHYFRIKYDLIFAAVRFNKANNVSQDFNWDMEKDLKASFPTADGSFLYMYTDKTGFDHLYRKQVIMIGSYVFIEPDMETWEDISIPIPLVINGKKILNPDGSVKMRPKEEWLVTKKEPEDKYLRGWVRYCGSPLNGDREFLRPGMYK
jgi:hypothetical protein